MIVQTLLAKVTAAGLATKAAAAGATVVVAASAAGAADALPAPIQSGFDQIVSADAEIEPAGDVEDADENSEFGQSVAEDATGEAEGDEPGVDGCEVAREASGRALEDCGDDTEEPGADEDGESDAMEGFGDEVAEDAQDGGVDGEEVSSEARERNPGDGEGGADNAPDGVDTEGADQDAAGDAVVTRDDVPSGADDGTEGTQGEDAAEQGGARGDR